MQPDAGAARQTLELSDFQSKVLAVPEQCDLFLGGGRGGGKSHTLALLALRHAEQYGPKARVLYLRQSYAGAEDFVAQTRGYSAPSTVSLGRTTPAPIRGPFLMVRRWRSAT